MNNYIYHSTIYEKAIFRELLVLLDENSIDYKVFQKSNDGQFRAPLSAYFEAEIHVAESDFERADKLINFV